MNREDTNESESESTESRTAADTPADKKDDAQPADTGNSAPDGTSKSGEKDDLKSISMADVFAKLGSTKDGLTAAEAAKRLTQ
jgi:hypothetical protein